MRRDTLLAFLVIAIILGAFAGKSLLISVPPVQRAPDRFDATRAKARLAYILGDQRPHPADSEADDAVRNRLVLTLAQMGLKPVVRDQMACNAFEKARLLACARVRNVVAMLGPWTGKALLLSAHYDSVPVGPGASDDGIGVATLLETGSILQRRPLRRPVLLLFNEGEELGLVGARAFLSDPLSGTVDSLLNFEARGVNGPVTMFETSRPNAGAIEAYAGSVRHKFASSLSTDVARLIPNDTDVTVFKERNWLILNSAIVGNETRYHSPGDDLSGLDVRSLQDMGDEALGLATRLSQTADARAADGNRIFFDLAEHDFLALPLSVGVTWLLLLLGTFAWIGVRSGRLLTAVAIVLGALVLGGLAGWLGLVALSFLRSGTFWRAYPELTFMALYASILAGELALLLRLGHRSGLTMLRNAYWLVFLLIGGLLALAAPGAMIYFLIPPSIALAGNVLSRWKVSAAWIGAVIAVLFLFLSWGELLGGLEELFTPGPLWIAAPCAAVMVAPALIEAMGLFRAANRNILVGGTLAITLAFLTIAAVAPAYSQDHQQRFTIEHVTQFPSGRSFWSILNDGTPLPKEYRLLGAWHQGKLEFSERHRWMTRAPAAPGLLAPVIAAKQIAHDAQQRTIRLRIRTNGAERISLIAPASAHIVRAGVPGFQTPVDDRNLSAKFTISCTGRSCDGAALTLVLHSDDPVDITVVGSRNGLPQAADRLIRARPPLSRPQYVPDEIVTISHVSV